MNANDQAEIIRQLKQAKQQRGLTYQNIIDMAAAHGSFLSLSTVRRVFSDGSEQMNFRYNDTIRPIAEALLGLDPMDDQITLVEFKEEAQERILFLKEQLRIKTDLINNTYEITKALIAEKKRCNRVITILTVCLAVCLAVIFTALFLDWICPTGWMHQ